MDIGTSCIGFSNKSIAWRIKLTGPALTRYPKPDFLSTSILFADVNVLIPISAAYRLVHNDFLQVGYKQIIRKVIAGRRTE
jgi:hypothetical protein